MTRQSIVVRTDGKSIFFRKLNQARDFVLNKVEGPFEMVWRYDTRSIDRNGDVSYSRNEWPVRDSDVENINI